MLAPPTWQSSRSEPRSRSTRPNAIPSRSIWPGRRLALDPDARAVDGVPQYPDVAAIGRRAREVDAEESLRLPGPARHRREPPLATSVPAGDDLPVDRALLLLHRLRLDDHRVHRAHVELGTAARDERRAGHEERPDSHASLPRNTRSSTLSLLCVLSASAVHPEK
jgi:hypothetical protein